MTKELDGKLRNCLSNHLGKIITVSIISSVVILMIIIIPFDQIKAHDKAISQMDCKQLALYIRDGSFTSYVYGVEGTKFSKECIQPIFHLDYVSQTDVDQYVAKANCEQVLAYAQSYFPYYHVAQDEYTWRCSK